MNTLESKPQQKADESIEKFAQRVQELVMRAYPSLGTKDRMLQERRCFINNMLDRKVAESLDMSCDMDTTFMNVLMKATRAIENKKVASKEEIIPSTKPIPPKV
jgi:hypothetical protein